MTTPRMRAAVPTADAVAATVVVAASVGAFPLALVRRLMNPAPVHQGDLLIVVAAVVALLMVKALADRDRPIDGSVRRDPIAAPFDRLFDQSFFGAAGMVEAAERPDLADRISHPLPIALDLAPPIVTSSTIDNEDLIDGGLNGARQHRRASGSAEVAPVQAVLPADDVVPTGPLVDYTVARGDTFWSIAELVLGDGKRWRELRRLNLGREVAPGHVLGEDEDLRIGWTIALPAEVDDPLDQPAI